MKTLLDQIHQSEQRETFARTKEQISMMLNPLPKLLLLQSKVAYLTAFQSPTTGNLFVALIRQVGESGLTPNRHEVYIYAHDPSQGRQIAPALESKPIARRTTKDTRFLSKGDMQQATKLIIDDFLS